MDSHGAAWGRTAGSQPGQQPSTEAVYRCNYWQDHAVGASGQAGDGSGPRPSSEIHPPSRRCTHGDSSIPPPPDLTPQNTPFHIQRDTYPSIQGHADTLGDNTQTLKGTCVCLMWQKAARETATPLGMVQHYRSREKLGDAPK